MTHIETMKLALEALKDSQDYIMGRAMTVEAAESLEEAIAKAKKQEQGEPRTQPSEDDLRAAIHRAAESACPKLVREFFNGYKQEHGEPVAWLVEFENGEQELHFDEQAVGEVQIPLYTATLLPAYKPAAWMDADGNLSDNNDHKCFPIPLYTTPQQRKPLTDEQIKKVWGIHDDDDDPTNIVYERDITRAIEAAHGIKE